MAFIVMDPTKYGICLCVGIAEGRSHSAGCAIVQQGIDRANAERAAATAESATIATLRRQFEAELTDAMRDLRNFACTGCSHIGCVEARAACRARVQAWTVAITALGDEPEPEATTECQDCGLSLAAIERDRGYSYCGLCRGAAFDTVAEREGLR